MTWDIMEPNVDPNDSSGKQLIKLLVNAPSLEYFYLEDTTLELADIELLHKNAPYLHTMDFHGINFNSKNGLGLLVSEKGQYIRLVDKHGDEFIKQENTAKYVKKIRLGIRKGSNGLFGERDRNYVKIVRNWIFYIIQKHSQVEYLDIIHDSSLEDMPSQHTEHVL